jgi:acylphosphatase
MDKAKIIIKGETVQEIGYRVSLLTNALNFGISNFYAYNTKINDKQAVIVLISAEKETINDFYDHIKENIPEGALVSDFEIEDFAGNVMDIERYLHLIQIEQLNKGIPAILDIRDNTKKMLEKQDSMLEKQDSMLEKQDLHIKITETGFAEVKKEMAKGFAEVKEEIHMLRDDFRELFMHEVSELRSEIAEVKAAIARMQAA